MVIEPVVVAVIARCGDRVLARSERALRVREVGRQIYDPVIYFPAQDVDATALRPTGIETSCPLKGTAAAFDVATDPVIERGAWSYQQTLDFDPRIAQLKSYVAFDSSRITLELAGDT